MEHLPIFFDVRGRACLVVGAGEVAARKAGLLRQAGAQLHVVAPAAGDTISRLAEEGALQWRQREFQDGDLDGMALVIAATDSREVNERVADLAAGRGLPVNVVDHPSSGNFVMPSVVDRSPIQIAVSTGGASPVLARTLRARLETVIPSGYGRLGALLEEYRGVVKQHVPEATRRRTFWEDVLQGPVAELMLSGQDQAAKRTLEVALEHERRGIGHRMGEVYLVGAGPGDPDLLTFRALRLMQQADVIVHDRLVSQPVLDLCRRDAERIYVGKERSKHAVPQHNINQLLVDLAKQGRRVCRLKGGDPFIFGRGGEEIETLFEEGVPFQVVPGITAASGTAAYAGIPLTHRDYSQSVVFATGHLKDGTMNLNWTALAQPNQTVVFYMGLHGVKILCKELIAHGMPTSMPVALIQKATTPEQKVVISTLERLPVDVERAQVKPPTLIVVGEVVKLHQKLAWFEPATATQNEDRPESDSPPRQPLSSA